MRRISICLRLRQTAKAVTAAFALVLVLLLGVCAASPSLHLRLHADRAHAERFCVVCALAAGQLGWAGVAPIAVCACVFLIYNVFAENCSPVLGVGFLLFSKPRSAAVLVRFRRLFFVFIALPCGSASFEPQARCGCKTSSIA